MSLTYSNLIIKFGKVNCGILRDEPKERLLRRLGKLIYGGGILFTGMKSAKAC